MSYKEVRPKEKMGASVCCIAVKCILNDERTSLLPPEVVLLPELNHISVSCDVKFQYAA